MIPLPTRRIMSSDDGWAGVGWAVATAGCGPVDGTGSADGSGLTGTDVCRNVFWAYGCQ